MPEGGKILRIAVEELAALEQELSDGKSIELVRGGSVVAEVRAKTTSSSWTGARTLPNFEGRMKAIWGDKVFPAGTTAQWVRDGRDSL